MIVLVFPYTKRVRYNIYHIIHCLILIVKERTVEFSLFSGPSFTYPIKIDHPQHDYCNVQ